MADCDLCKREKDQKLYPVTIKRYRDDILKHLCRSCIQACYDVRVSTTELEGHWDD